MSRYDETPRAELGIAAAAAFLGAAGVGLAAVAAHRIPDPALATAAQMLMIHAVAVLALAAWAVRSRTSAGMWRVAARLILLGVTLFSGDIALRSFYGERLFALAAPLGGSLVILGWVAGGVAALKDWLAAGRCRD